jgi:hypothetical protein
MSDRGCPVCGCQSFYVRDSEDSYEIYEFDFQGGIIQFKPAEEEAGQPPEIRGETETYCGFCSWHGKFNTLK